jgi:aldose 1-epimerase
MRYSAETTTLDGQSIVLLSDHAGQRRLRVATHGAALVNYEVTLADGRCLDLADGYRDAAEIASRPGSRFAIMAPFAGRIAAARYRFDGVAQDLQPGVVGALRASRHGFVRGADFAVTTLAASDEAARVVLSTASIRPQSGYPHAIDLAVSFVLDAGGLSLEASMRNVGTQVAPCFFGWHPYFRVTVASGDAGAASIDGWQLQIPADTVIRTDAELIALPGVAAFVPLASAPELDFRVARAIGDSVLDHEYTGLQAGPDGRCRTRLRDPASGATLVVWQQGGVMHAFTADTAARGARQSVALEPMECMADAFNREECADAIRLLPGAERVFRCGLQVELA